MARKQASMRACRQSLKLPTIVKQGQVGNRTANERNEPCTGYKIKLDEIEGIPGFVLSMRGKRNSSSLAPCFSYLQSRFCVSISSAQLAICQATNVYRLTNQTVEPFVVINLGPVRSCNSDTIILLEQVHVDQTCGSHFTVLSLDNIRVKEQGIELSYVSKVNNRMRRRLSLFS
jgi:hypothetical protein